MLLPKFNRKGKLIRPNASTLSNLNRFTSKTIKIPLKRSSTSSLSKPDITIQDMYKKIDSHSKLVDNTLSIKRYSDTPLSNKIAMCCRESSNELYDTRSILCSTKQAYLIEILNLVSNTAEFESISQENIDALVSMVKVNLHFSRPGIFNQITLYDDSQKVNNPLWKNTRLVYQILRKMNLQMTENESFKQEYFEILREKLFSSDPTEQLLVVGYMIEHISSTRHNMNRYLCNLVYMLQIYRADTDSPCVVTAILTILHHFLENLSWTPEDYEKTFNEAILPLISDANLHVYKKALSKVLKSSMKSCPVIVISVLNRIYQYWPKFNLQKQEWMANMTIFILSTFDYRIFKRSTRKISNILTQILASDGQKTLNIALDGIIDQRLKIFLVKYKKQCVASVFASVSTINTSFWSCSVRDKAKCALQSLLAIDGKLMPVTKAGSMKKYEIWRMVITSASAAETLYLQTPQIAPHMLGIACPIEI